MDENSVDLGQLASSDKQNKFVRKILQYLCCLLIFCLVSDLRVKNRNMQIL